MKEITRSQLALCNGQDREEVWVAYRGYIYDLSKSPKWLHGRHYTHWAGQDLTKELQDAPHSQRVLQRFQIVAKLKT